MYAQDASESSFLPWGLLRVRRVAPRRSTSCCHVCRWPHRTKPATSDPVNMTQVCCVVRLPDNPSSRQDFTSKRKPPRRAPSVCLSPTRRHACLANGVRGPRWSKVRKRKGGGGGEKNTPAKAKPHPSLKGLVQLFRGVSLSLNANSEFTKSPRRIPSSLCR